MAKKDKFARLDEKELEKQIAARFELIKKIHKFAESVVRKYGKVVKTEVGSCNTHIVARLDNFGGFNFILNTGMTMMGGNMLDVEFNSRSVLSVYFQCILDECRVDVFDESANWQSKLEYVMSHMGEIIAKIKKDEAVKQEQKRIKESYSNKREKLLKMAERLKL